MTNLFVVKPLQIYRVVARISAVDDSDEGGEPIARCTLRGTLAAVWPRIVATQN